MGKDELLVTEIRGMGN